MAAGSDRFYVVGRSVGGIAGHALVRGIPAPEKTYDAGKDSRDGETMLEGPHETFWQTLKDAGFRWVEASSKRYWIHAPKRTLDLPDVP